MEDVFEVGFCIIFVIVFALVTTYWRFFLALGILIAVIFLVSHFCSVSEAKQMERNQKQNEKRIEEQRKKDSIKSSVSSLVNASQISFTNIRNYANGLGQSDREYCYKLLRDEKEKFIGNSLEAMKSGRYKDALEGWEFLSLLFPGEKVYSSNAQKTRELVEICNTPQCTFISNDKYGKPKWDLKRMKEIPFGKVENVSKYFLMFTVGTPFDLTYYLVLLDSIRKETPKYFRVSVDEMISLAYIKNHQNVPVTSIFETNEKNIQEYIESNSSNAERLKAFASGLCWAEETKMEARCLEKMQNLNALTPQLKSRYAAIM